MYVVTFLFFIFGDTFTSNDSLYGVISWVILSTDQLAITLLNHLVSNQITLLTLLTNYITWGWTRRHWWISNIRGGSVMVFNATFSYIWQVVLMVEYPKKTTDLSQDTDKLYHIMVYTSPWSRFEHTTLVVICTDYIGSCKSMRSMLRRPWYRT